MRKGVFIIAILIGACGFMTSIRPGKETKEAMSITVIKRDNEKRRSVIELMIGSNAMDLKHEVHKLDPFFVTGNINLYWKDKAGKFCPFEEFDEPGIDKLKEVNNTLYYKMTGLWGG